MSTVFVPGRPAPQGSKRHLGNGIMVEASKAVKPWRVDVAWAVRAHFPTPLDGPVRLELEFVMPRPKSAPKRSTPPAVKRPDLDKLARAVLDAITGVVVSDDSQIVELVASKRIAEIGERSGLYLAAVRHEPLARPHPVPAGPPDGHDVNARAGTVWLDSIDHTPDEAVNLARALLAAAEEARYGVDR